MILYNTTLIDIYYSSQFKIEHQFSEGLVIILLVTDTSSQSIKILIDKWTHKIIFCKM